MPSEEKLINRQFLLTRFLLRRCRVRRNYLNDLMRLAASEILSPIYFFLADMFALLLLFYPGCGSAQPPANYNFFTDPQEPHWASPPEAGWNVNLGTSAHIPKEDKEWQAAHDCK